MTDQPNTTRTDTTRTDTTTRPPQIPRRYPNNEENMDAPLVPFIQQPGEEDELTNVRRELAALRAQLNRIERAIQNPTDTQ
ncbi:hypothetical protein E6P09_01300 [Haloferax mediterranei ATCC 33500]|uniref:Uncharacterized protein n=1 Tax=Haloferax mediterranei (strain ATCC 33500 / DSM 1411 / JCM 8866 / NBRC 14739 / NCIMB 2177 / R-4) TaxID=523841 RepID=M0IWC6_HALMT|nr:hypothetical protein [Haloferax mediterranei]AHZ23157.1 hypothetical protein BM92_11145 [Haloferax mediterranei ATCC 33500]EMA00094.1 hypothetical protein C439_12178 [Haloferax mediterranei ATCC 33500]MDX5987483.1 hypothetical protein [Haloferax mediterranei ATCC 33500]QCQ73983.1 hypothetical protein E6P09_01300 [Haloferax mediterranei ATCC 33500]